MHLNYIVSTLHMFYFKVGGNAQFIKIIYLVCVNVS